VDEGRGGETMARERARARLGLMGLVGPAGLGLALAWGLAACDGASGAETLSDASADARADTAAAQDGDAGDAGGSCDDGARWCEGDDTVVCEGGAPTRTPCGPGTFCNAGQCAPTAVSLPDDASPHKQTIEWWYYTGHLTAQGLAGEGSDAGDATGAWGFELALFQQDMSFFGGGLQGLGFMCHVAVTDKLAKNHVHDDSITVDADRWPSEAAPWPVPPPVTLEVQPCLVELGGDGRDHIRGVIADPAGAQGPAGEWVFDLDVAPTKHVTYHGGDGVIAMGDTAGDSYYYSYTRMTAQGTVTVPGATPGIYVVEGQAWMDHQWGDFDANGFKGWDWWSVQLDSGYELMLFQFRDWDDVLVLQRGTITDPAGGQTDLVGLDAVTVTPLRQWASPHTDGVYPLDWDIDIPSQGWHLEVRTSVDDQEMPNLAQNYWEGAVEVAGTRGGVPDHGVGYVELTGYASDPLDPQ